MVSHSTPTSYSLRAPILFSLSLSTFCGIRPDPSIHFFVLAFLGLWVHKKVCNDAIEGRQQLPQTQSATDILHTIVYVKRVRRKQKMRNNNG